MSDSDDLVQVRFVGEPPPQRERWEETIRRAYGRGFGKAKLVRVGDSWRVEEAFIQEPTTGSSTLPTPTDARERVVAALKAADLPVAE